MNKYKWISWHQPTGDYRPLSHPPAEALKAWWCSGTRGDGVAVLVAAVAASSKAEAEAVVLKEWPEATDWRFCEDRRDLVFGDRFPVSDWMRDRGCSNVNDA